MLCFPIASKREERENMVINAGTRDAALRRISENTILAFALW